MYRGYFEWKCEHVFRKKDQSCPWPYLCECASAVVCIIQQWQWKLCSMMPFFTLKVLTIHQTYTLIYKNNLDQLLEFVPIYPENHREIERWWLANCIFQVRLPNDKRGHDSAMKQETNNRLSCERSRVRFPLSPYKVSNSINRYNQNQTIINDAQCSQGVVYAKYIHTTHSIP